MQGTDGAFQGAFFSCGARGVHVIVRTRKWLKPACRARPEPIEPMTLGNMRQLGVRSLDVTCSACRHEVVLNVDAWPDHMPVPAFGPRMACTRCGNVGADARPNWREYRPRGT